MKMTLHNNVFVQKVIDFVKDWIVSILKILTLSFGKIKGDHKSYISKLKSVDQNIENLNTTEYLKIQW